MRVLIVDDHPMTRVGLQELLRALDPAIACTQAGDAASAIGWAREGEDCELVLLDMSLPGTSGLDALAQIREAFPSAVVAVVSANESTAFIRSAFVAGAAGYIPKTTDGAQTRAALRLLLDRGVYIPPQLLHGSPEPPPAASAVRLSARQLEVLQRLLQAKTIKVISRELDMAEGTVRAHISAIYAAVGLAEESRVNKRAELINRAQQFGLIDRLPPLSRGAR